MICIGFESERIDQRRSKVDQNIKIC